MKHIIKKTIIAGTLILALFLAGCSNILDEKSRATYTVDYFTTQAGLKGSITTLYAQLRYIYGGYYTQSCVTGTDEATWAQSADNNFKDIDLSGAGSLTPTSSRSDGLWNNTFPYINTANGIIQYGSSAGLTNALIAEARFFRAFDYFMLVQTFGGVPLDLGAGDFQFNTSTSRTSKRNTVPEVYTKAIFPDLIQAIADLPDAGRVTGGATKTLARLYLAKAYLTYGWWLGNPNSIATYPTCNRTDPNGHDATWYYQQAYNVATTAIMNPASFGLQSTFYDLNVGSNDRNNEVLLYADHTQASESANGGSISYGSGAAPDNFYVWFATCNYTNVRTSTSNTSWTAVSSVQREAAQSYGRPWTRMCPTIGAITNTFADKTNDSRYDGTFVTVYRGNWAKGGITNTTLYNANYLPVANGDSILSFLDSEPTSTIDYSNSVYKSNVGVGVLPGRADFVVSPSGISRLVYPGLWKLGTYRTDNGTGLGSPNGAITRPFNIAKFSELFFIAAEAAVKGATPVAVTGTYANDGTARGLINVIRARAGKWKFSNAHNKTYTVDNSVAMMAATPATITIDYILAERSREYYGEGYRWYDLVRTQTWASYAASFKICGTGVTDHTPVTYTRTIPTSYYLRPIPQGEIDGLVMTDAEKAAYQNPGY